jgi:glyoxylase-like metal-dependent hydrolase (beta-lactamase superfamily II)
VTVHLPEHTSGSIGVLFNDSLFAGDLVMNMPLPSPSMFADNFCLLQESIAKAKTLNAKIVYPSHGRPFSSKWLKRFSLIAV